MKNDKKNRTNKISMTQDYHYHDDGSRNDDNNCNKFN